MQVPYLAPEEKCYDVATEECVDVTEDGKKGNLLCKTEAFLSSANPGLQKEGQEPRAKGTACERSLHREELKSSLYREELKKVSNT